MWCQNLVSTRVVQTFGPVRPTFQKPNILEIFSKIKNNRRQVCVDCPKQLDNTSFTILVTLDIISAHFLHISQYFPKNPFWVLVFEYGVRSGPVRSGPVHFFFQVLDNPGFNCVKCEAPEKKMPIKQHFYSQSVFNE